MLLIWWLGKCPPGPGRNDRTLCLDSNIYLASTQCHRLLHSLKLCPDSTCLFFFFLFERLSFPCVLGPGRQSWVALLKTKSKTLCLTQLHPANQLFLSSLRQTPQTNGGEVYKVSRKCQITWDLSYFHRTVFSFLVRYPGSLFITYGS